MSLSCSPGSPQLNEMTVSMVFVREKSGFGANSSCQGYLLFEHFTTFPNSLIRVCSENDSFGLVSQIAPSLPPSARLLSRILAGSRSRRCINQSNSPPLHHDRPTVVRGGVGKRILNFVRDQSEIGPVSRTRARPVLSSVVARSPIDRKRDLDPA